MSNGQITDFRIGDVLGRSFAILARNLAPFGALAVLFMAPPFLLAVLLIPVAAESAGGSAGGATIAAVLFVAAWIALYFVLSAVLMYGTICELRGTRASIGESLRWVLGVLFPVIGITIVASLSVFAGLMLLIVPGLILLTMWCVAVPAAVVERIGVIASLRRSMALTSGFRWRVFGLLVVVYLAQSLVENLLDQLFGGIEFVGSLIGFAVTVLITAFDAVVAAVCYHDLRILKDGVGVDEIARVFD